MKKITVVYERNEETNAIELRTIVIFDDNKAPVVTDYVNKESLIAAAEFITANGYDVLKETNTRKAVDDGLVTLVSRTNAKAMAELRAEIMQEELKYGAVEDKVAKAITDGAKEEPKEEIKEEVKDDSKDEETERLVASVEGHELELSQDDRQFAQYLKLYLIRKKRELTREEEGQLFGLVRENERARVLEDALIKLENKEITKETFDEIYNNYRAQLSGAIKNAGIKLIEKAAPVAVEPMKEEVAPAVVEEVKEEKAPAVPEVKEEKAEEPKEEPAVEKNVLNIPKEDRDYANYLKLVMKREKAPLSTEDEGKLMGLVRENERARALEESNIRKTNGTMTEEEYNTIYAQYRKELADSFKKASKEAKVERRTVEVPKVEEAEVKLPEAPVVTETEEPVKTTVIPVPVPVTEDEKPEKEPAKEETKEEAKVETVVPAPVPVTEEKKDAAEPTKAEPVKEEVVVEEAAPVVPVTEEKKDAAEPTKVEPAKEEDKSKVVPVVVPVAVPAAEKAPETKPAESEKAPEKEPEAKPADGSSTEEPKKDDTKAEPKKEGEPETMVVKTADPEIKGLKPGKTEEKVVPVDGKDIKVKKTAWWKKLLAALGIMTIVGGIGALVAELTGKNKPNSNGRELPKTTTDQVTPGPTQTVGLGTNSEAILIPGIGDLNNSIQLPPVATEEPEEKAEVTPGPTEQPIVIVTASPEELANAQRRETINAIESYCTNFSVPAETKAFLMRAEVLDFLTQYTNADQRSEVISALCYGYEANLLTTKEGNFRLAEDGSNYLYSFTRDFLCAKVVVNGYSARQMKTVFGNQDVSYEQIIGGFKNFCYTVTTYGMTAHEPLPFRYLTNNSRAKTDVLNNLMEKLIVVNTNRDNHTLTSQHTDDFISEVFDTFVLNDESIELGQGTKDVAGAIVEAYVAMQSQIANGEPLYLHEDRGYARAGINLQEVDGHFAIGYPDKTTYEFTSLYDVMNHGYGSHAENAERCLSEQEVLMSNITAMSLIDNPSPDAERLSFATFLDDNGLHEDARYVRSHEVSESYLTNLAANNPHLAKYINSYIYGDKVVGNGLIDFDTTCENVDRLVGVNATKNNYADLINNRRTKYRLNDEYTVLTGKRYTSTGKTSGRPTGTTKQEEGHKTVTVVETHEQITKKDMNPQEREEAERREEEIRHQEEQEHAQQQEEIREGKEELRDAVEEGASQERLEEIAEEHGITLDPDYKENMEAALEEQRQGEAERIRQEQEIEERNRQAEAEAARRAEEEARRQEEERRQQEELIRQSMEADEAEAHPEVHEEQPAEEQPAEEHGPAQGVDQTDPGRVDEDAEEEDYNPDTASIKQQLNAMKMAALNLPVDVDGFGYEPSGPRLG